MWKYTFKLTQLKDIWDALLIDYFLVSLRKNNNKLLSVKQLSINLKNKLIKKKEIGSDFSFIKWQKFFLPA